MLAHNNEGSLRRNCSTGSTTLRGNHYARTKLQVRNLILANFDHFVYDSSLALNDDHRTSDAYKDGGFALEDQVILTKYRQALKDLIKQVGKMIISGKFELYKVSFPIKCMSSRSILAAVANLCYHAPTYLNAAALTSDPVERMKNIVTFSISYCYSAHTFEKPLNPILGETYQARMEDGTEVLLE